MKKYLVILLCSFFAYAETDSYVMKVNKIKGIKVIQDNNNNNNETQPIINPVCNNEVFGQCTEGQSQYTSAIGANVVTWNCTSNNVTVSCSKTAELSTDGVCGSSHNTTLSSSPTENLCNTGNPSFVTETSTNYNWSCSGSEGTQTIASGNTVNCTALKPISALNTPYVVSQSAVPFRGGFVGTYARFTSECAQYPAAFQNGTGFCYHYTSSGGGRYIGNHIKESLNPTFYMTYSEPVSINSFSFSGFSYNHSIYASVINFKYKDSGGQWVNLMNIKNPGSTSSAQLYIKNYTLPETIIGKEFAIEAVINNGYFNLGYFKVLN